MTLIEVMMAVTLSTLVLAGAVTFYIRLATDVRFALERLSGRLMLVSAREFLLSEMRSTGGDLSSVNVPNERTMLYHPIRWATVTCSWPTTSDSTRVTVRSDMLGLRDPAERRDTVEFLAAGYPSSADDDTWLRSALLDVQRRRCPDGSPGLELTVTPPSPGADILPGMPVVGWETAMVRVYRGGDGAAWLGFTAASSNGWDVIQPAFGPLDLSRSRFGLAAGGAELLAVLVTPGGDSLITRASRRGIW